MTFPEALDAARVLARTEGREVGVMRCEVPCLDYQAIPGPVDAEAFGHGHEDWHLVARINPPE